MPNTSRGYPYPTLDSPNNVPADMQNLAETINDDVAAVDARATTAADEVSAATSSSTPGAIVRRNTSGQVAVATPTSSVHAATKGYVDSAANSAKADAVAASKSYVDTRGYVGKSSVSVPQGQTVSVSFTFPAGRFSSTPAVVASPQNTSADHRIEYHLRGTDTTGATVAVRHFTAAQIGITVHLIAIP